MTDDSSPKPWQPQPEEPPEWYNRFHIYLTLGPSRTLAAAYREWANSDGKPSGAASRQSAKWNWNERAMAFDQANREEKAAFEAARNAEARERRIRKNNKILESVAAALDTADLENLSTEEAPRPAPFTPPTLCHHGRTPTPRTPINPGPPPAPLFQRLAGHRPNSRENPRPLLLR